MSTFSITGQSGFHITFENGWTVSVQFGRVNYCANRYAPGEWASPVPPSRDAEVAVLTPDGEFFDLDGGEVRGWQSPAEVLALMVETAARAGSVEAA